MTKSKVLEDLGLEADEVRAAFSVEAPKTKNQKGYLFVDDQKKMIRRLKMWERLIYARFMSGMSPKIISSILGVSEETVRVRLRKAGFFKQS